MSSSSSSGLTFKLHPLVIVNISDHYTRVKSQSLPPPDARNGGENSVVSLPSPPRVYECVIGVQRGRIVEIFNSFELLYDASTHSLDRAFHEKKQELYKKVFPNFYILGWYSTGSEALESDMIIHKALMDINESPVYVLRNPFSVILHRKIYPLQYMKVTVKLKEYLLIMSPILSHLMGVQLQLNWLLTLLAYTVQLRC